MYKFVYFENVAVFLQGTSVEICSWTAYMLHKMGIISVRFRLQFK